MSYDLWLLYELMLKSRLYEEAIARLWEDGYISGEMHLGTGEEAIVAGVVAHLRGDDAMALDHRSTAPLLMRGVDPTLILRELLGHPEGLCGGMGGHMHLYSKAHLSATSGIVGAAGPMAVGFGLAAQHLRPGTVSVAFFGEGAINQGMLMESMNLAVIWNLPVLFVCKDDGWSITTESKTVTAGSVSERVNGLGLRVVGVDGYEVSEVWEVAKDALERIRSGGEPACIHARCVHVEGHFLGYQLIRTVREPLKEMPKIAVPLTKSFLHHRGAPLQERITGLKTVISAVLSTLRDPRQNPAGDPIQKTRAVLQTDTDRIQLLEDNIQKEVTDNVTSVLSEVQS